MIAVILSRSMMTRRHAVRIGQFWNNKSATIIIYHYSHKPGLISSQLEVGFWESGLFGHCLYEYGVSLLTWVINADC